MSGKGSIGESNFEKEPKPFIGPMPFDAKAGDAAEADPTTVTPVVVDGNHDSSLPTQPESDVIVTVDSDGHASTIFDPNVLGDNADELTEKLRVYADGLNPPTSTPSISIKRDPDSMRILHRLNPGSYDRFLRPLDVTSKPIPQDPIDRYITSYLNRFGGDGRDTDSPEQDDASPRHTPSLAPGMAGLNSYFGTHKIPSILDGIVELPDELQVGYQQPLSSIFKDFNERPKMKTVNGEHWMPELSEETQGWSGERTYGNTFTQEEADARKQAAEDLSELRIAVAIYDLSVESVGGAFAHRYAQIMRSNRELARGFPFIDLPAAAPSDITYAALSVVVPAREAGKVGVTFTVRSKADLSVFDKRVHEILAERAAAKEKPAE